MKEKRNNSNEILDRALYFPSNIRDGKLNRGEYFGVAG